MVTLIVYDSKFGNTEQIARAIAEELEPIGLVRLTRQLPPDFAGVSLMFVGGPTHGHGISAPLRGQLELLPRGACDGVAVATFDTRYHHARWLTGSAAAKIARHLRVHGARLVAPPESFFVEGSEGPLEEGEIERARAWARRIRGTTVPASPKHAPVLTSLGIFRVAAPG